MHPRLQVVAALSGWLLACGSLASRAELVYENFGNTLVSFVTLPREFGDEITFAGSARTLKSMTFEIVGEQNVPADARARFRVYSNNGPIPPAPEPPVPTPGELLYQSDDIPIHAGTQAVSIVDLAIPVPHTVTWTVEFLNTGLLSGQRAGLQVYHPPTVGRSFRDYWIRDPDTFRLYLLEDNVPGNFGARFEALPDPPVTVIALPNAQGLNLLQIKGPIGSEQLVEVSTDLNSWRLIGSVSLATTNSAPFLDPEFPIIAKHYRARPSPYPGRTVILKSLARHPNGSTTLTLSGPAGSETLLESSIDRSRWSPVDIIRFTQSTVTYDDPRPTDGAARFYRTRRSLSPDPLFLIRSISRTPEGHVVLDCTGRASLKAAKIEASSDLRSWSQIGSLRFDSIDASYTDTNPPPGARFYRLSY